MASKKESFVDSYDYSQGLLTHDFKKVVNQEDWKLPTIEIVVDSKLEAHNISKAVAHFTGDIPSYKELFDGKVLIEKSLGYYLTIGA